MVDAIEDILELGGNISDDTTFGTRGKDLADLSNDSFKFVGNVDKITLGTRGKDLADLSNDSLDLVCDVNKISLGDGGIGVEDMVDSVDNVLELGGNISDDTTFGNRGKDLADLSNDSLDLVGNVDKISLGDGGIGVEDMVDSVDD